MLGCGLRDLGMGGVSDPEHTLLQQRSKRRERHAATKQYVQRAIISAVVQ